MSKLFYLIAWVAILGGTFLILLFTYWMVYPYDPLVFTEKEFTVSTKTVKPGEMLSYVSKYCKKWNFTATVTRSFINGIIYVTPSTITNRPIGCNTITIGVVVPKELPPGEYYMQQIYQISVNPIRTVTIKQNTELFTVTE